MPTKSRLTMKVPAMRRMAAWLSLCLWLTGAAAATPEDDASSRRSSRVLANVDAPASHVFVCRILLFDVLFTDDAAAEEADEPDFYMCNPVRDGEISTHRYPIALAPALQATHRTKVAARDTTQDLADFYIGIPYGYIDPIRLAIVIPDVNSVTVLETLSPGEGGRSRQLARSVTSVGTYTALVLRITDENGRQPSHSNSRLWTSVFSDNVLSLRSQYQACSWGAFQVEPSGVGVLDVTVSRDATDGDHQKLTQVAETVAMEVLGVSNLFDIADFILYVTPPMGDWIAYASVGGGYSVFNSAWGGYIGSLMHELAHNLGLLHSNEGVEGSDSARYQDFSGYMSGAKSTYLSTSFPAKCFNGANHWELGWYSPQHSKTVRPNRPEVIYLGAFCDADKFSNAEGFQEYAVLESDDYYIQYNAARGINRDTGEAPDKITVVKQAGDGTYLVGEIDSDEGTVWTLEGTDWTIAVCAKAEGSDSFAEVLTLWIGDGTPDCDGGTFAQNTCLDHHQVCTGDEDCCSQNCRPNGTALVCLPNPNSQESKNQFRISPAFSDERRRLQRHVRGSRPSDGQ